MMLRAYFITDLIKTATLLDDKWFNSLDVN